MSLFYYGVGYTAMKSKTNAKHRLTIFPKCKTETHIEAAAADIFRVAICE